MSTEAQDLRELGSHSWLPKSEDWWAVIVGLGLVMTAILAFKQGNASYMQWLAVTPKPKWAGLGEIAADFHAQAPRYVALFALWAALLGLPLKALGFPLRQFLPPFILVFALSALIFTVGQWVQADRYNLEPPLIALLLGLAISNLRLLPAWMDAGFRVEYYIKTGIVLLGATVPFSLLFLAGPVALAQASVVSVVTFGVIYLVAVYLFDLDQRLSATLAAGGAICGVSAAIAVAGAVGARRQDASVAITLVIAWAIVLIFLLPTVSHWLGLPAPVAGAWIGTSEVADAAGLAAVQTYAGYAEHGAVPGTADSALTAFTLVKVVGRDAWIGIWAFVLALLSATDWEGTAIATVPDPAEIWRRFPKFVLGFLATSVLMTIVTLSAGSYADFNKVYTAGLVGPIKILRTWAFIFTFLSIGLTTRLRELSGVGAKPLIAFSSGVLVNVVLGLLLSAVVFGSDWQELNSG